MFLMCRDTYIHFGPDLGLPYTIPILHLLVGGRGVPHVSVTHTPLAAVLIFNKFLNLKNFSHPRLKRRRLSVVKTVVRIHINNP